MKVDEILKTSDVLLNAEISIEGVFVMRLGVGYFVDSQESSDNINEAIFIDYPNLEKYLAPRVPGFARSEYSYCDNATIVGVLKKESSKAFKCSLTNIKLFTVYKYGNPMPVLP